MSGSENHGVMISEPSAVLAQSAQIADIRRKLSQASTGRSADRALIIVLAACAFTVILLVIAIAGSMIVGAAPSISRFGFGFLVSQTWDPPHEIFGALPFIY